ILPTRLSMAAITEQVPPYAPSAKGTVENLFRWMTQRFERRLPNTSYGIHDAKASAEAGGMTLEELERCAGRRLPASLGRTTTTTAHHALGTGSSTKRDATVSGIS